MLVVRLIMEMLDGTITGPAVIITPGPMHHDSNQMSGLTKPHLPELKAFAVPVACQPTLLVPEAPLELCLKPIKQNAPAPTPIPDHRPHEVVDLVAVAAENEIVEI